MCKQLFLKEQMEELVAVWGRDKLGLTPRQYNSKVQVYKKLNTVWTNEEIQLKMCANGEVWDQGNTVLIDDSAEKARAEPHNLLLIPEFIAKSKEATKSEQDREDILSQVEFYVEGLRWEKDVSRSIRIRPFCVGV
jgi:hypothetical protein